MQFPEQNEPLVIRFPFRIFNGQNRNVAEADSGMLPKSKKKRLPLFPRQERADKKWSNCNMYGSLSQMTLEQDGCSKFVTLPIYAKPNQESPVKSHPEKLTTRAACVKSAAVKKHV